MLNQRSSNLPANQDDREGKDSNILMALIEKATTDENFSVEKVVSTTGRQGTVGCAGGP